MHEGHSQMGQGSFKVKKISAGRVSRWRQYAQLVVGKTDLVSLLKYEVITCFFGNLPGALGLYLRGRTYPLILGAVGPNVVFGRGITLRHPHKIRIGRDVIIDDHCMVDAKGQANRGISIGDGAFIGRNSVLYCKDGDIEIQPQVNIGFNCGIFSSHRVIVGRGTMVAAYCYIMSGGSYELNSEGYFAEQDGYAKGPTIIGEGCWLGAKVVVQDGASIGERTVVGTGAVVIKDLPARVVAVGIPAKALEKAT